ncbi:PREDICTED: aminoacyl tRNA synthase complex-interacting multifunctional protein 1-like [Priapulus caudatus]|uniref:Aminoacyl tRNA synthase complex-interacting multifunctional protein 1-like n=1 Tax=Priapulus caudatus TaxID=37621 RepID=A0ABM1DT49_PRICU|nr:PREDICTED: aminoacyl tRNA synthase complex-interacting multifunctional protein 1-like [Priapulus caudatus]
MASEAEIQLMEDRANRADEIIQTLRVELASLQQAAVAQLVEKGSRRLREENEALKREVQDLKRSLYKWQVRNGATLVPLPSEAELKSSGSPGATPAVVEQTTADKRITAPAPEATQKSPGDKAKTGGVGKKEKNKGGKKEKEPRKQQQQEEEVAAVDVSRLDFRIGRMVSVKKHPDADTLYIEEVDLGEGKHRTVVSGLVKHCTIEEMTDRLCVFMCNLKPAKMRGILSEAMVMCASSAEHCEILVPPPGSEIGDAIVFDGYSGTPDAMLNPKKKVWEQVAPDLQVSNDRVANYKGSPFSIAGKGFVMSPSLTNVQVK